MVDIRPEALRTAIKWNPVPLRKDLKREDYPITDLPPIIRKAVEEVHAYVQAPIPLVAACALSVVSTSLQAQFDVRRDAVLTGPTSLYLLTVAESGERKTAVDKLFTAPLIEWQAQQSRVYREAKAQYDIMFEAWQERGKELETLIAAGLHKDQLETAFDPRRLHEAMMPREPRKARMLRGDDTTEALMISLQDYPVAAILNAEAGIIFGSHSMNAERVTGNLSVFNILWDGGTLHQNRVGREEVHIDNPRATVGLMVQQAVLQSFIDRSGDLAKGIGYFARFLFSRPESTQGTRLYADPPENMPALRSFQARVSELLAVEPEYDELDRLAPKVVEFSQRARHVWITFHDEVEMQLGGDEFYSGIKGEASKAAENAARLACCFHVFSDMPDPDEPSPITEKAMLDACAVMRWYLDEAVIFGQIHGLTKEVQDAELVEQFLVSQYKLILRGRLESNRLTVNRVRQHGPGALRGKGKDIDAAVATLCDHGRIIVWSEPGSKSRFIAVAPQVMKEYGWP